MKDNVVVPIIFEGTVLIFGSALLIFSLGWTIGLGATLLAVYAKI